MVVVTGGAGFIGSHVVGRFAARGEDVVVCDWLANDSRWRNLAKHQIAGLIAPETLTDWLRQNSRQVKGIVHMGAISATSETDVDLLAALNIRASLDLIEWCTQANVRLIYASSAAVYGDGKHGFDDTAELDGVSPLNAYGWSKLVVDRRVITLAKRRTALPPQCVGLRFFNVYGPNEYHKGTMQSVIAKSFSRVQSGEAMSLFRSARADYEDGGQLRDFVYVRDCVDVIEWLMEHPEVSGIFNVGTGQARSWLDLSTALFRAANRACRIDFIDMPEALVSSYQYFTQAEMGRLREAGYTQKFMTLEQGVGEYVQGYLATPDPYH